MNKYVWQVLAAIFYFLVKPVLIGVVIGLIIFALRRKFGWF